MGSPVGDNITDNSSNATCILELRNTVPCDSTSSSVLCCLQLGVVALMSPRLSERKWEEATILSWVAGTLDEGREYQCSV